MSDRGEEPNLRLRLDLRGLRAGFCDLRDQIPEEQKWGYHEWFHISVLMGNLVSMGFDLGILGLFKPCAEGVACASLASRLTFGLLP